MEKAGFLFLLLFALSSFVINGDGTYQSAMTGKKTQETLFGDYIQNELPGDQVIIVVSYGCDHCWNATKEISILKKENLLNGILVLGTGTAEEKEGFRKETATDDQLIDYDFEKMKLQIKAFDPAFPPPPFAIWTKDNVVKAVFTEMPSAKAFKKCSRKSKPLPILYFLFTIVQIYQQPAQAQ